MIRLRLTPKLILSHVLFATVLLVVVSLLAYNSGRAALQAATVSDLFSIATEKEAALNNWIAERQSDIIEITTLPDMLTNLAALFDASPGAATLDAHRHILTRLQAWTDKTDAFLALSIIESQEGKVIVATDADEEGKFREDRPEFINGKKGLYVQNPYYSLQLLGPTMSVSGPFRAGDGRLLGVLVGRLNLEKMTAIITRRTALRQTDDAFLANTSNLFVTQPRLTSDRAVLQLGVHTEAITRCLAQNSGIVFANDYRGVPAIVVYRWLPERELCLIVKMDQAEALEPAWAFGTTLIVISSLALLATSLLAVGLARTLTRPILALQAGVSRLGQGELDVRLPEATGDELGLLAREFNTMAATIAEKDRQLRDYTSQLEQKVQERTAALQASEAELRALFTAMTDIILVLDAQGRYLKIAPTNPSPVVKSPSAWIGQTLHDVFPAPQADTFLARIQHALEVHHPVNTEYSLLINNVEYWFASTISPLLDDTVILVARDITERKRAEEALEKERTLLRLLINHLPDFVYVKDTESRFITSNAPHLAIMGLSTSDQVIGRTDFDFFPHNLAAQYYADEQAIIRSGQPLIDHEEPTVSHTGEPRWALTTKLPLRDNLGQIIGIVGITRDVTERKRADEALRESEERFRTLVETAPGGILVVNRDGTIVQVNKRAETLFGYTREELVGAAIETLIPGRFRQSHVAYREGYFANPSARPMGMGRDLAGQRKDGSEFPVEIGLNYTLTAGKTLTLAFVTDITERKRAEEDIVQSLAREQAARAEAEAVQHRLAFLLEASTLLTKSIDYLTRLRQFAEFVVPRIADWCVVYMIEKDGSVNQMAVTHADPAKVAWASELQRRYPPDPNALRGVYQVLRSGEAEFYPEITDEMLVAAARDAEQLRLLQAVGFASVMTVPLVANERILGAISLVTAESGRHFGQDELNLVTDLARRAAMLIENARFYEEAQKFNAELERLVTERTEQLRESEAKFSKAFRASPAAISIATLPDGRWIEINDALVKMTGYSRDELIGHTSIELGLVDAEARAKILESIRTQGSVRDVEIQMHTKSKEIIDVLLSVEHIELNGQACTLGIQYDITEIKRAEREVRRLNDDLEQRQVALEAANKELEAFSYSVSHDLRAPLRAIDGFSRILLRDYPAQLPPAAERYLRLVRDNAQQMGQLIDDLLAFSRLGRQSVNRQRVAPANIARRVLEELSSEQDNRQIEITIGDLPTCQADPALLKEVFVNLLSNALKFTRQRDVARIEVGSRLIDGQTVYFVKDNGAGFDMQYADKLFGVFQRLHRAEEYEGTGVGLALVQRIIHRHGGRVWAEAEVDQGATFYFTLEEGASHD